MTITSVDNTVASGRKRVTVSATAAGGRMVAAPSDATLTIRDDEFGLDESAVTGHATEDGGTATFTVALRTQPSAAVTVSVTSLDTTEGRVAPSTLTFTTQNWETAQTVTVTGADDDVDDGDVDWKVRLDTSSGDTDYNGLANVDVDVTTIDNDGPPTVTLALDPASIPENGGILDSDGAAVAPLQRGHHGDGGGGGERRGGRLHAERGDDADDRGREHIERRRGDDQGGGRRRRCGCRQDGDGLGERGRTTRASAR